MSSIEGGQYMPREGDVVVFPAAPLASSRTRRYVIVGIDARRVAYIPEDRSSPGPYVHTLERLRAIGIRKADEPEEAAT